jgi:hypothetical protein
VWDGLRPDLSAELDFVGMSVEVDEPRSVLWRGTSGGTVKANRMGKVWAVGCSGSVCTALRAVHRFNAYLSAIGTRPHRVTRLDATIDLKVDAAPVVAELTRAGRAGELSLTRKKIKPADVLSFTGTRFDGAVTGTVYLGTRRADARMVVYDKQHERISRKLVDVGPLTRYELRLKAGAGVTLRDASQPAAVFWHYASPEFLPAPPDAPEWVAGGSGYDLPPSVPLLASERLLRKLEGSPEVAALLALAFACGPYGVELLISHLRQRAGGAGVSPAVTALGQVKRAAQGIAPPGVSADSFTPPC